MDKNTKKKFDEFREACRPAVEFLRENYHPMSKIIISDELCEVLVSDMGAPNELRD